MSAPTWAIATLERKLPDGTTPPDGQVYTAHWTVNLEDQGESAGAYGSVGFGDPDPNNYTPFDQLTEDQVIGWVKATLGDEQVAAIETALAEQIQQKLNPTSAAGVPW
jgi:hypothetical protein